jgi:hypothetical protein
MSARSDIGRGSVIQTVLSIERDNRLAQVPTDSHNTLVVMPANVIWDVVLAQASSRAHMEQRSQIAVNNALSPIVSSLYC